MKEIPTIAVLGGGTLAQGIARAAASAGFRTYLHDLTEVRLDQSFARIASALRSEVESGALPASAADATLGRLLLEPRLGLAVEEAGFVIEAVQDDLSSKVEALRRVEENSPETAVLATSTGSLSVTQMAVSVQRPGLLVGMHFAEPIAASRLVEVVRGLATDDEAVTAACAVAHRMEKEPVVVSDSPGLVAGRIRALLCNEAFGLLQEGIASPAGIDTVMKLGLGLPEGPLALADEAGLDTRLADIEELRRALGEKFRPSPLLVKYVRAGWLGRKSGRGVFSYRREED